MIKRFKDKIKNKVISPDYVVVGLITGCIVFLLCGILILLIALFYDKVELWADILMFIIAGFCFVAFLLYAIFVPILLLQYPKHKKLLHVLLKKSVFLPDDQIE